MEKRLCGFPENRRVRQRRENMAGQLKTADPYSNFEKEPSTALVPAARLVFASSILRLRLLFNPMPSPS